MSGASVRPPLLWSVFGPSSVRFFFSLALSGFARSGLGVLVLVFSLFPVFFCVPRLVFRLGSLSSHGHFHLIFMFISSTLLRQGLRVRVCVYHLNRCKTSYYCRGVWHSSPTTRNEAVGMSGKGNVAGLLYLQLYLYV